MTDLPEPGQPFTFTKAVLKALPLPRKGKRHYYLDTFDQHLHLSLAVSAGGTKSVVVQRRVDGKPRRHVLGRFPDMTIEQARRQAGNLNLEIAAGQNPYERTRPEREGLTLAKFFDEYLERHAKPHKRSWQQDADMFRLYAQALASIRLARVTRRMVSQLHVELGAERGHRTANRVLQLLRIVFRKAIEWDCYEGENPATGVRRFPEYQRERFLLPDELPKFAAALVADAEERGDRTWHDFFWLALYTGARRSNLLSMRWEDIDLEHRTWTIPATRTKTRRVYRVPLSNPARIILEQRREFVPADKPWVFPSWGSSGHVHEPKFAWERIRRRSGLLDLRIHDLRRTLGSWQAAAGTSLPIIGRSLGHSSPASTAIYARMTDDPVMEAVERAAVQLRLAAEKGGTS